MKQLIRNLKIALAVLLVLSLALGAGLVYQQYQSQTSLLAVAGENKAALRQRYQLAGQIVSADGTVLAGSEDGDRVYTDNPDLQRSMLHLVGDYTRNMTNTIETLYQDEILGNMRNVPEQFLLDVTGRGLQGSDVHLTINAMLNEYTYNALKDHTGAAVLMNYETGEILSMVSTPATLMENVISYRDIPDSALFNRALNGRYAPGSTFKILTSGAWLSSSTFDPSFQITCSGEPHFHNGARDIGHGTPDLNYAFTSSCNVFFGDVSVKIGQQYFSDYLEKAGLGALNRLDRLRVSRALYNNNAARQDDSLLSWFGTGQPVGELVLTMTPLEMALIGSAVANGGNLMTPHVVSYVENPLNNRKEEADIGASQRMFTPQVAARLQQMMLGAIASDYTIQSNARIDGLTIGGKSGTVEIDTAEGQYQNALWVGYISDSDYPYAIAVVIENARGTNSTAVAIGADILREATRH